MKKDRQLLGLEAIVEAALREEGVSEFNRSPAEVSSQSVENDTFTWENKLFGKVTFRINGFQVEKAENSRLCSWALLSEKERPWVSIDTTVVPQNGTRVLFAIGKHTTDVTESGVRPLKVNVHWHGPEKARIPHTREKDKDNFDLILISPEDGTFIELQVSIVTINRKFWITVQEVYAGQGVKTTHAKAEKMGITSTEIDGKVYTAVPLYPENANPDSDYLKSNAPGYEVLKYIAKGSAAVCLSKCRVSQWNPQWPALSGADKQKGRIGGVTLWYNVVIGLGFVLLEDGTSCHVRWDKIVNEDGTNPVSQDTFPMIHAMKGVILRKNTSPDGRSTASMARNA